MSPGIKGGLNKSELLHGPTITVAVRRGGIAPKIDGPSIKDAPLIWRGPLPKTSEGSTNTNI